MLREDARTLQHLPCLLEQLLRSRGQKESDKQLPLDADVDELLNSVVEFTAVVFGGEKLDLLRDVDPPHQALGASNSCFFLTDPITPWCAGKAP